MRLPWALLLTSSWWIACGGGEPASSEAETSPPAVGADSSASTRWAAVRPPEDASLLEAPAVARVSADATGDVAVTLRARVERVHVRAGSVVRAGDPIVDVGSPELLEAAAAYGGASRRLAVHASRAEELDALREEGLVERSDVFAQRAAAAELREQRDRAAAILRGAGADPRDASSIVRRGYVTLTSPVAGVVTALRARPGEILEPGGPPFARVVGEAPARIEVRTSEAWPDAASLVFRAVDGRVVELSPDPISSVVDPDDGTRLSWYAPMDEAARFQDGVQGVVRMTAARDVWQVPVDAVAQRTGESWVMRRRGDEVARVDVQVVTSSGATALVRGDLRDGDSVAADVARSPAIDERAPQASVGAARSADGNAP